MKRTAKMAAMLLWFALGVFVLAGCSGGAPPDSIYQGAYSGGTSRLFTSNTTASDRFSGPIALVFNKKGSLTGTLVSTNTGETFVLRGECNNAGDLGMDIQTTSGVTYRASGSISKQGVPITTTDAEGKPTTETLAGIAGNFVVTVDGVEYSGQFVGAGGTTAQ